MSGIYVGVMYSESTVRRNDRVKTLYSLRTALCEHNVDVCGFSYTYTSYRGCFIVLDVYGDELFVIDVLNTLGLDWKHVFKMCRRGIDVTFDSFDWFGGDEKKLVKAIKGIKARVLTLTLNMLKKVLKSRTFTYFIENTLYSFKVCVLCSQGRKPYKPAQQMTQQGVWPDE